jgi:excisionase family DNA binding protein
MAYMTTQQAADKWGLTDRRVRVLCRQGRIPGVIKSGRSYRIPAYVSKPSDARVKKQPSDSAGSRYLKWNNDVIGTITPSNDVVFSAPQYNEVVTLYTQGADHWTADQFTEFLAERIVSRDRRDIERILFRCGLSHYDVQRIAEVTRGIHPKDLLWIAQSKDETLDSTMTDVFSSVFLQRVDKTGDSIDTPEGYNIKRYGVYDGKYGIYKQRISPLVTDVESEIAVYLLGRRLGVPCCPAVRAGKDTVFSVFLYEYAREYFVHFRRLFAGARSDNEYQNLIAVRPQYRDEIARMILLDFITRQDDRHLSNMAIKVHGESESFYPLYDNGRSLFYEDTEEMTAQAVSDVEGYSTSFGYTGSYWDYVQEIASERNDIGQLIDLDLRKDEVAKILETAGFRGYRFDGTLEWITKACRMLRKL